MPLDRQPGSIRRYLAIVQDERGYPPPQGELEKAPPEGPAPPLVFSVIKTEDHDAEVERLREAMTSALTSLGTGPLKDGYAYAVLEEALDA